jgi:hypothetical protein
MTYNAQDITITLTLTKREFLQACMIAGIDDKLEPEAFKQSIYPSNPLLPLMCSDAARGILYALEQTHAQEFPVRYPDDFHFDPQE